MRDAIAQRNLFSVAVCLLLLSFQHDTNIATADVVVSDDFESQSLGGLNGQAGGSGWTGNWSTVNGVNVVQGGLHYNNGEILVDGGNQKLELSSTADGLAFSRQFSQGTSGSVYMSMLFQPGVVPDRNQDRILFLVNNDLSSDVSAGIELSTSDSGNQGFVQGRVILGGGFSYSTGGSVASTGVVPGNTYLLIARLFLGEPVATERLDFWFNPSFADEGSNLKRTTSNTALSSFVRNYLTVGTFGLDENGPDSYFVDEIRIGTSWNDVVVSSVPEPSSLAVLSALVLAGIGIARLARVRILGVKRHEAE